MKHKSPKQLRIDKKKPRELTGAWEIEMVSIAGRGSRVKKLPSFEEYNPNRIHVARRRRAHKDHHTFPRGWTWGNEETSDHVIGSSAATAYDPTSLLEDYFFAATADPNATVTLFKDNDVTWYMNGEKVS